RTPILASRWLTWLFTVASLTTRRPAISRLDRPSAIRASTSPSRGVRPRLAARTCGAGRGAVAGEGNAPGPAGTVPAETVPAGTVPAGTVPAGTVGAAG